MYFSMMGYRAQTQKPIIHLKSKGEKIPFDVTTIRAFDYDLTDLDNVEQLRDRLQKPFNHLISQKKSEDEIKKDSEVTSLATPILYQILDEITKLESKIEAINTDNTRGCNSWYAKRTTSSFSRTTLCKCNLSQVVCRIQMDS